jgi:hypothetical protein
MVDNGIALHFLDLSARRGWLVSTTLRPLYPGKYPVPIVQEAGWAPGPVWTCAKNLATTGIRSPDRPARSQSAQNKLNSLIQDVKPDEGGPCIADSQKEEEYSSQNKQTSNPITGLDRPIGFQESKFPIF